MAEDHVSVRGPGRAQPDGGPEGEVVDQDGVRSDLLDDLDRPTRSLDRLPEQIVGSRLGLVAERRDHPFACGGEERPKVLVLAGRLLFGSSDTWIRPRAQRQSRELHPCPSHQWRYGWSRGNDHLFTFVLPRARDADQRDSMRGVVRADDEERHDAIESRECSTTRR